MMVVQVYKDITQTEADIKTIEDAIEAVQNAHYGVDMRIAIKRGFEIINGLVTNGNLVTQDDLDTAIDNLSKVIDSKLEQQDLNIKQIVAALQKFEVPIEWDGENIVIREDV
ncbi:hypothetical protein [Pediococcus acidilactici]|jgi:formiminotetrahydrofolate cyclodeaminase|uniref:hypothetical protein n=2 Tax=Pediococcus acidilactici TaxID=1254 RepID=UPI001FFC6137|nr:hypothetical protein [Pediococcus acidilactici]MCK2074525.1 hypothetical protein [Pediococcus acidilactici]